MKTYICDFCEEPIKNPHEEEMKEFYLGCEHTEYGVFPVRCKRKIKIHMCDGCYKKFKDFMRGLAEVRKEKAR